VLVVTIAVVLALAGVLVVVVTEPETLPRVDDAFDDIELV
jgi:hypothetical protein